MYFNRLSINCICLEKMRKPLAVRELVDFLKGLGGQIEHTRLWVDEQNAKKNIIFPKFYFISRNNMYKWNPFLWSSYTNLCHVSILSISQFSGWFLRKTNHLFADVPQPTGSIVIASFLAGLHCTAVTAKKLKLKVKSKSCQSCSSNLRVILSAFVSQILVQGSVEARLGSRFGSFEC